MCSTDNNTKKIVLDDTWYGVDIDGEDIKCVNEFEFKEVVNILLTDKQQHKFMSESTNREFEVSKKRINKMFTHINRSDNVWRK